MKNTNKLLVICFLVFSVFLFLPNQSSADDQMQEQLKADIERRDNAGETSLTGNLGTNASGEYFITRDASRNFSTIISSGVAFMGGKTTGLSYKCYYTGTLQASGTNVTACYNMTFVTTGTSNPIKGASGDFRLFPTLSCTGNDALVCWLGEVWRFSQGAILALAVAAFVIAGIIYMTSAGNPKQIAMSKKIIIGALSAVAVMVLGRFFLVNVVGVEWIW